jgi:hypothetical protein
MMKNNITINVTKVDFDDVIRRFQVLNIDAFGSYMKEIWRVIKFFKFNRI